MTRSSHPDGEVERLLRVAEKAGWRVLEPKGHWGRIYCPHAERGGCRIAIFDTTHNQVRILKRELSRCPHGYAIA